MSTIRQIALDIRGLCLGYMMIDICDNQNEIANRNVTELEEAKAASHKLIENEIKNKVPVDLDQYKTELDKSLKAADELQYSVMILSRVKRIFDVTRSTVYTTEGKILFICMPSHLQIRYQVH